MGKARVFLFTKASRPPVAHTHPPLTGTNPMEESPLEANRSSASHVLPAFYGKSRIICKSLPLAFSNKAIKRSVGEADPSLSFSAEVKDV